jgi:uncharacterized Zn-finger protein
MDDHVLVKWANHPETENAGEHTLGPPQSIADWAANLADHTGSQRVRVDEDGALAGAATLPVAMVTPTTSGAPNFSSHVEHNATPSRDTPGLHTQGSSFARHCEDCDNKPSRANILKKRKRTGEKLFACQWEGCGYRAAKQGSLNTHKRTHTGEKPFACQWEGCGYRSAQQGDLNRHERTHTGEKPFACQWEGCEYRAAQQGSLNTHERTHTGEKPFACQWEGCGYRSALKATSKSTDERTRVKSRLPVSGRAVGIVLPVKATSIRTNEHTW